MRASVPEAARRFGTAAAALATLLALLALLVPASHCWLPMGVAAPVAHGVHGHGGHQDHEPPAPVPYDRLKCPLCQGRIWTAILPETPAALPSAAGYLVVWRVAVPPLPGLRPLLRPSLPRAPPAPA
jgi:hypothetical protein